MSGAFSFSDDKDATFPEGSMSCTQIIGDIERTMKSSELGEGSILPDGSVKIEYSLFTITLQKDGSFHGQRKQYAGRS